jgi:UDP-N-acetylglucosamine diphosphorylase / glucose-1-phosphate thymidylyltransferase / UDP-N-acetylgalactosamine diphosphorylase / glucosamine-1-phosphate N-acetyltransferase / galactosamine-1-phosphate N-acetyltransferase
MKNINVLLLAAGDSERFWPFKDKNFTALFGKTLISYSIDQLARFGLQNFVIVGNKNNLPYFENLIKQYPQLIISVVEQKDPRGMAGAVLSARNEIKGKPLIIHSPTDVFEDSLISGFTRIKDADFDAMLAGTDVSEYFPGAYLTVKDGFITNIIEKPGPDKVPGSTVNFVFDYFKSTDKLIHALTAVKSGKDDLYEKALLEMIKNNQKIKLLHYKGYWGFLKYPWQVLNISSYFLSQIKSPKIKNAAVDLTASIIGNVVIEDGARILEYAKIVGPTYIGRGTIVGNFSVVRESMVGASCVVGMGTEVARSYVGDGTWFHNNYVGDSVIGDNVSMGAGTVLANYRLDEKTVISRVGKEMINTDRTKLGAIIGNNVRIGVNASVMPGIKIGRNSVVGPGVVLDNDLPDDSFCKFPENRYTVKKNILDIKKIKRHNTVISK